MVSFTQSKLHFETEILIAQSYTDLSRYSDHRQKVLPSVLLKLRKDMGFKQIRFHCHKKKAGTVFHIMTNINQLGEAVVEYFTFASPLTTRPEACGSYSVLPDDNSTLSEDCSNWSGTRAQVDGKWGVQGASHYDFPILEAINRYGEKKKDDRLFYAKPKDDSVMMVILMRVRFLQEIFGPYLFVETYLVRETGYERRQTSEHQR